MIDKNSPSFLSLSDKDKGNAVINDFLQSRKPTAEYQVLTRERKYYEYVSMLADVPYQNELFVHPKVKGILKDQVKPLSLYEEEINNNSAKQELPENFIRSIIKNESSFRPTVKSPVGAIGLMQVTPIAAKEVGFIGKKSALEDPTVNIQVGTRYLRKLSDHYFPEGSSDDRINHIIAAYNAGPTAVKRAIRKDPDEWLSLLPEETQNYVNRVQNDWGLFDAKDDSRYKNAERDYILSPPNSYVDPAAPDSLKLQVARNTAGLETEEEFSWEYLKQTVDFSLRRFTGDLAEKAAGFYAFGASISPAKPVISPFLELTEEEKTGDFEKDRLLKEQKFDDLVFKTVNDYAQEVKQWVGADKLIDPRFKPPETISEHFNAQNIWFDIVANAPQMALNWGALFANPVVGSGIILTQETGSTYHAMKQYEGQTGRRIDDTKKALIPLAVGSVNLALEKLTFNFLKTPLSASAEKGVRGAITQTAVGGIYGGFSEGTTEAIQDLVAQTGEFLYDEDLQTIEQLDTDRLRNAFFGGLWLGTGAGTVKGARDFFTGEARQNLLTLEDIQSQQEVRFPHLDEKTQLQEEVLNKFPELSPDQANTFLELAEGFSENRNLDLRTMLDLENVQSVTDLPLEGKLDTTPEVNLKDWFGDFESQEFIGNPGLNINPDNTPKQWFYVRPDKAPFKFDGDFHFLTDKRPGNLEENIDYFPVHTNAVSNLDLSETAVSQKAINVDLQDFNNFNKDTAVYDSISYGEFTLVKDRKDPNNPILKDLDGKNLVKTANGFSLRALEQPQESAFTVSEKGDLEIFVTQRAGLDDLLNVYAKVFKDNLSDVEKNNVQKSIKSDKDVDFINAFKKWLRTGTTVQKAEYDKFGRLIGFNDVMKNFQRHLKKLHPNIRNTMMSAVSFNKETKQMMNAIFSGRQSLNRTMSQLEKEAKVLKENADDLVTQFPRDPKLESFNMTFLQQFVPGAFRFKKDRPLAHFLQHQIIQTAQFTNTTTFKNVFDYLDKVENKFKNELRKSFKDPIGRVNRKEAMAFLKEHLDTGIKPIINGSFAVPKEFQQYIPLLNEMSAWFDYMKDRFIDVQTALFWSQKPTTFFRDRMNDAMKGAVRQYERFGENVATSDLAKQFNVKEKDLKKWIKRYNEIRNWGLQDYVPKFEIGGYALIDNKNKLVAFKKTRAEAERAVEQSDKELLIQFRPSSINPFATRKDVLVGEENIFDSMRAYGRIVEKELSMKPKFFEIEELLRRAEKRNKKPFVDGKRQPVILDPGEISALRDAMEKELGRLLAIDIITDQTVEALAKSDNTIIRAVGLKSLARRTGTGLARKLARKLKHVQVFSKLGFRLAAPIVNAQSGFVKIWSQTSTKTMLEARSWLNTEAGQQFINDNLAYLGIDYSQSISDKSLPAWHPLKLFSLPEAPLRRLQLASSYIWGRKMMKYDHPTAQEYAKNQVVYNQVIYELSSLPNWSEHPFLSVAGQFKEFLTFETFNFMRNMNGRTMARYVTGMLATGGPMAFMAFMETLPIFMIPQFEDFFLELQGWTNANAPKLSRGFWGYLGYDLSGSVAVQFPTRWEDYFGIFGSIATILGSWATSQDPDQYKVFDMFHIPIPNEVGQKITDEALVLKNMRDAWTTFNNEQKTKFKDVVFDPDQWSYDARKWRNTVKDMMNVKEGWVMRNGKKIYPVDNFFERASIAAGMPLLQRGEHRVIDSVIKRREKILQDKKTSFLNAVVKAMDERDFNRAEDLLNDLILMGWTSTDALQRRIKVQQLPPEVRRIVEASPQDAVYINFLQKGLNKTEGFTRQK